MVLLYILSDLAVNLSCEMSIEYMIPVRPLLLILMNNTLRREVATLTRSILEILPVLRMYGLVVVFVGIMAFILFGDSEHNKLALRLELEDTERLYQRSNSTDSSLYDELEGNMDSFWFSFRSILTMFVFVSSAENYTTVVYPGMQMFHPNGGLVLLLFVPVVFLGMFTMMAMITGIFEDVFVKKEAVNRMRDLWWKRTGIISGFILLDYNDDGLLTLDEFIDFVLFLRSDVSRLDIMKLFKMLDADNSGTIELNEFVNGVERLSDDYNQGFDQYVVNRVSIIKKEKKSSLWLNMLAIMEMVWSSWFMHKLRGFLFVFNFWIFCWINIDVLSNRNIAGMAQILMLLHIGDVLIKLVAMQPLRYWNYSKYHKNEIISEFANRCDLFIASLCLMGYIVGIAGNGTTMYFNVFSALILLRIFVFWDVSLRFLFMIKSAFSSLSALFVVMFCVFFTYGTVGVSLFKGKTLKFGDFGQNYMKDKYGNANFDNLANAMITLVQGFVGEAFHEIMLVTKNVDGSGDPDQRGDDWAICFYVISYFLIMTLLFGNLFFGLLLSIFGCLYDVHKSGEKLTNHTIKKASQLRMMVDDDHIDDDDDDEGAQTMPTNLAIPDIPDYNAFTEKSSARKESVTLDIVEPIPEEMAHNLSIGGTKEDHPDQQQLTPTATELDLDHIQDAQIENAQ